MSILRADDPNFGEKVMKMLFEEDTGPDIDISSDEEIDNVETDNVVMTDTDGEDMPGPNVNISSDDDPPVIEQRRRKCRRLESDSSNNSASESEENGNISSPRENPYIVIPPRNILKGKNNHCWSSKPASQSRCRTPSRNIIHFVQTPIGQAKDAKTPQEAFSLFFTDGIINTIVVHTNEEIDRKRSKYKSPTHTHNQTCIAEVKALLGIFAITAALKNNHLCVRELFNTDLCGSRYKATMSADRFEFLVSCLRFDDKETRQARRENDYFAPIREIWDQFIHNCNMSYKAGPFVTIDEQLLGFRGRCPFRMYIPNKPSKYGIKIVMTCDTKTKYMVDASPYLGKCTKTDGMPLGEFYVKEMTKTLRGSNRNITVDNWFTSVKLADDLLKQKLTLVGTIRTNKREIPPELLASKNRQVGTSMFCFDKEKTLVSYKAKANKMVVLLSTAHDQPTISPISKKPDIIEDYNSTKYGVDVLDQMCSTYSCSRKTRRWPLCVFYGMMNIGCVNSWVIHSHNNQRQGGNKFARKEFLIRLSEELTRPWMAKRLEMPNLQTHLRVMIQDVLPKQTSSQRQDPHTTGKRTVCHICPSKKRRMTITYCIQCSRAYCKEHRANLCTNCCK